MPVPLLSTTDYPPTDYFSAYGGKPTLPSPVGSASGAVAGNVGNLGAIYNLAVGQGKAGAAGAVQPYLANLPDYAEMTSQSSRNILSQLQGEVPTDVWTQIQQRGAERGISSGMPGAAFNNAAMLRALGTNSLALMQMGEQGLTGAMARTPRGPVFDPSTMFVTPEQQQQAGVAQAIYAAAPNPAHAAAAKRNDVRSGIQAGMRSGGGGFGGGASWTRPETTLASPDYSSQIYYADQNLPITYSGGTGGGVAASGGNTYGNFYSNAQDDWSNYDLDAFLGINYPGEGDDITYNSDLNSSWEPMNPDMYS